MTLYDTNKKEYVFNTENLEKINHGDCGVVYRLNSSSILKKYFTNTSPNCRLNKQVFDITKGINNCHLMNIEKLLFTDDKESSQSSSVPVAYIGEYLQNEHIDILKESIDYLLDNMKEISEILNIFTQNNVTADDVRFANVIMQKNNIILIDLDTWKDIKCSKEETERINKRQLLLLFKRIIQTTISNEKYPDEWFYITSRKLFYADDKMLETTNPIDIVSKQLKKVRCLKEYYEQQKDR